MADLEFDEFEGDYAVPDYGQQTARLDRAQRLVNMTGAVCSVALVLGLGIWGYQLAVRDVAGVPVMRALIGPMREAPADPGGDQASNQGLSVNAIAASGSAAPVSDQLTLAPRAIQLQPEDSTGLQAASTDAPVVETPLQITSSATPGSLTSEEPETDGTVLADSDAGPLLNADPEVASVATSLRPRARPASVVTASTPSKPTNVQTVAAPAPSEIDPATLQIGTRMAQLGAFDTPDLARLRFGELQAEFGELMAGKAMVIQTAQSGGRTFYRLRAHGFEGDEDARRFCAVLEAGEVDCIPVAQR